MKQVRSDTIARFLDSRETDAVARCLQEIDEAKKALRSASIIGHIIGRQKIQDPQ